MTILRSWGTKITVAPREVVAITNFIGIGLHLGRGLIAILTRRGLVIDLQFAIVGNDLSRGALPDQFAAVEQIGMIAITGDHIQIVGDKNNRRTPSAELMKPMETFGLEMNIAHR